MRHNDISNRSAPILCFNFDRILLKKDITSKSLVKRLVSFDHKKYDFFNHEFNEDNRYIINNIWIKYPFSIYLATETPYEEDIEWLLYDKDVYFTRIFSYKDLPSLRKKIDYEFTLYVDTDLDIISQLGTPKAIHLSELSLYLREGVR